jgi:hypothetical protein
MSDEGAFRDLADNYAFLKIESDKKIRRLELSLLVRSKEVSQWVSIHFNKRYTLQDGILKQDEHGELCEFNDILDFLERPEE